MVATNHCLSAEPRLAAPAHHKLATSGELEWPKDRSERQGRASNVRFTVYRAAAAVRGKPGMLSLSSALSGPLVALALAAAGRGLSPRSALGAANLLKQSLAGRRVAAASMPS